MKIVITIEGPTGSGKTTIANYIKRMPGITVKRLSHNKGPKMTADELIVDYKKEAKRS